MRRDDRQASRARRADADYFENEEDVVSGAGGAGDDAAGAGADEEEEEEDEGYRSDSSEEELGPRLLASPSGAAGRDGAAAPSTTSPGSRSGGASDGVVAIRPGGDAGRQDGGDGTVQPYSSKQLSSSAMKTIFGMMSYEELSKSSAKVIEDEPGVLRSLFTLVWQKSGRDLKDGFKYKRFRVPEASQFEGYGDQERFFTSSERQRLVFSVLRSVRVENNESLFQAAADNGDDSDEEQEAQLFEPKDEIVGKLLHKGVIKAVFPGHEAEPTFVMADLGLRFHIDNSIERIRKYVFDARHGVAWGGHSRSSARARTCVPTGTLARAWRSTSRGLVRAACWRAACTYSLRRHSVLHQVARAADVLWHSAVGVSVRHRATRTCARGVCACAHERRACTESTRRSTISQFRSST